MKKNLLSILALLSLTSSLFSQNISAPPSPPAPLANYTLANGTNTRAPNSTHIGGAAPSGATLGQALYQGSGCPSGTVSAGLAPDGSAISILFNSYIVEAGRRNSSQRKSCDFIVPIDVPYGYQVSIIRADYRGFNDLPAGTQSRFTVEYFLAGETGTPVVENFYGPTSGNYLLQDTVNTHLVEWSNCGQPVNFRVNNELIVWSNSAGQDAMATLDSADISIDHPAGPKGYQFYFDWRPCGYSSGAASNFAFSTLALLGLTTLL